MCRDTHPAEASANPETPAWGAVFAVAVSVAGLLTAEFLPVSLLTPMARDLDVSEGLAGQAVTATAFAAIFSSLLIATATRGIDRRPVVLSFSALLVASSLLVAVAPGFPLLLGGRVLLGLALGGFWAMAASIAMRLVPPADVPRALSIVFGGVSVAMVVAAPLGSFLGDVIGWRGVFLLAAALGAACWGWQALVLPPMPAGRPDATGGIRAVARRPGVGAAMLAVFCVFAGQFAFFTYMRPFYETVPRFDLGRLSTVLLGFGIANFVGTTFAAPVLLRSNLRLTLALAPAILAACAAGLAVLGHNSGSAAALTLAWGFTFGMVPVGWSTWVAQNLPDDAESAGGLQVAIIQVANTVGAGLGGLALDIGGATAPVVAAGTLLGLAGLIVWIGVRARVPGPARPEPDGFDHFRC